MKKENRNNQNNGDIFKILTLTDFRLRYQNSILGIIWVILKPLLLFLVLYVVFSFLFGQKDPHYKLNLFMGIIMMNFFIEGTTVGLQCLYQRANVLLKVNFPREIILYSALANASISLFFNICVFAIFWIFSPQTITILTLLIFIGYLILEALIIQTVIFFTSILYIKYRDLLAIWEVITSMLFYFTPVIYPLSVIPERYQPYVLLNPLAVIITNARNALIQDIIPSFASTVIILAVTVILFFAGRYYFRKNIDKIAEDF